MTHQVGGNFGKSTTTHKLFEICLKFSPTSKEVREAYFFNAEQRSSTDKSSRNYYPVAIIPKYDWEGEMPED